MGNTFVICGPRRKRAYLAGEIVAEERRQEKRREALATLDAVIRMFEPASNPELIAAIRPVSFHNVFFKRGEQMRLSVAALRKAGRPILCRQVVDFCLPAKGLHDLAAGSAPHRDGACPDSAFAAGTQRGGAAGYDRVGCLVGDVGGLRQSWCEKGHGLNLLWVVVVGK